MLINNFFWPGGDFDSDLDFHSKRKFHTNRDFHSNLKFKSNRDFKSDHDFESDRDFESNHDFEDGDLEQELDLLAPHVTYSGKHFVNVGEEFFITCSLITSDRVRWTHNGEIIIPGEGG